jgi:hypothetical protein
VTPTTRTSAGRNAAGTRPVKLAADLVALWLPATIVIAIACNTFVLLLTPSGALPSPRWRWWALVTAATPPVLLVVVTLVRPAGGGPPRPPASPLDLSVLEGGPLIAYQAAFAVAILRYGCTTWTGSSAAPWPTGCSRCSWAAATPPPSWTSGSCSGPGSALLAVVDQTVEPTRASFWTLPRPYQEAKTRAWPPEPSS